mgnify:CR=1 FL=1
MRINRKMGPPIERKWFRCKYCGKKLLIYNNVAESYGVYIRCKNCGREVEIKI